jgi:Cu(I)-responsive transcriptional regulator
MAVLQSRIVARPIEASRTGPARNGCSIGEAASASGVSAKMIRYYESIGLVRPATRSAANYRHYDREAIRTLRFVARARGLGFALDDIARLVALWQEPERRSADVKSVALAHVAELEGRIAALQAMKAAIERLAAQCHGDGEPQCPILDELWGEGLPASAERNDG